MKKLTFTFCLALILHLSSWAQLDCSGDTLAPSLTAVNLSSAIVDSNNWIRLFAIDFSLQASDNCSPENKLIFTFDSALPVASKINEEHYFKGKGKPASAHEFQVGKAQLWKPQYRSSEFTVNGCFYDNSSKKIAISCWDENFNEANDTTNFTFIVLANFPCHHVNFHATTRSGQGLSQFEVKVEANDPEFPLFYTGDHVLCANLAKDGLEICATASKTTEASNGIGVNDLLLLRNHILGIKKITDPYKLIAGDVNNDKKLTATDLTELKRMLYGFQSNFTKRHSWLLIPKDFVFASPENPWADLGWQNNTLCQTIHIAEGDNNFYFIAIKIGDIDFSAKP